MQPYYQDDSCTIYHGDCREVLPTLSPVDAFITDPPYGIDYQPMRPDSRTIVNDEDLALAEELLLAALGLVVATAHIVWCSWRSLPGVVRAMEANGISPKTSIVWDKGVGVQNLDRWAKAHEL